MDKYESASNIFQRIYELFYLRVGSGRPWGFARRASLSDRK